jgi:hypothetical protein
MLCVHDWIKLDSLVLRVKAADQSLIVSFQVEDEEEAAAGFEDVAGFASSEDDDRIVYDCCTLDVEVFDVYVFFENELPGSVVTATVCSSAHFEGVGSEIYLCVNGNGLIILPQNVNLFCHLMQLWQLSMLAPLTFLNI